MRTDPEEHFQVKMKTLQSSNFLFSSKNTELSSENGFVCQVRVSIAVGKHFFWAMLKSNSNDFLSKEAKIKKEAGDILSQ